MRNILDVKIVVICRMENSQQQGAGFEIQNFGVNSFELACCSPTAVIQMKMVETTVQIIFLTLSKCINFFR